MSESKQRVSESADRALRIVIDEAHVEMLTTFSERRTISRVQLPTLPHQLVTAKQPLDINIHHNTSLIYAMSPPWTFTPTLTLLQFS